MNENLFKNILKRLYHLIFWNRACGKRTSVWMKGYLRLKYDCYISRKAELFCPETIKLSSGVYIERYCLINYRNTSDLDITVRIGKNTSILAYAILNPQDSKIEIGDNCSINPFCRLCGGGGLTIGNDVRVGTGCIFLPMNHIFENPNVPIRLQGENRKGILIGNDVWFGAYVKVLDGVTIGDGCVIGAGSVVNKNIPPYSVAAGVPVRIIKKRI